MKVVWRGGRQYESPKQSDQKQGKSKAKVNGGNDESIMIIDSDEEEEQPSYQLQTEETEVDPAYPFEDVIRHIDIPLGSTVLDVAVPRVLPETARSSLDPFPPVLSKMIVVAAVCADYSTRVVALPLVPPHPGQTDPSSWQIQTLAISGVVSHQEIPSGVSITFTCQEEGEDADGTSGAQQWDLLVATHSAEASGVLLVYRIPILEESTGREIAYVLPDSDIEPHQRCYLPAPAKNIAFNPSSYPSARHSTLLVSFHSGCVKIYSCFSVKPFKVSRGVSGPKSNGVETTGWGGKWLLTLYPGFEQSPSGTARRKTVIHAEWVLGGRAVMVLLADGEWGVWDIEGAGPGSVKGPLQQRQSSVQGVTGGSLTAFSVSGRILSLPGSKSGLGGATVEPRAKFAPMTPSTKRLREDTLLKGSLGSFSPSLCGEISVFQTNSTRDPLPDESILFRHGDQSAVIPSLLSLWRNAVKATGTFDSSNRCRVSTIQNISLMGEKFKGVGHLPAASRRSRESNRRAFDILVTAEHRIIILAPRLTEPETEPSPAPVVSGRIALDTDQLRLRRGELGVDGMDRLLSGMASANPNRLQSPVKRARHFL